MLIQKIQLKAQPLVQKCNYRLSCGDRNFEDDETISNIVKYTNGK